MNTCKLIHLIVFFLLGLKWLYLLLPVKASFELTEVFLRERKKQKKQGNRFGLKFHRQPAMNLGGSNHLATFYVQVQ